MWFWGTPPGPRQRGRPLWTPLLRWFAVRSGRRTADFRASEARSWFDRLTTNGRSAHHEREEHSPRTTERLTASRSKPVRPELVEGRPVWLGSGPFMVRRAHHERQQRTPRTAGGLTTNGRGPHHERVGTPTSLCHPEGAKGDRRTSPPPRFFASSSLRSELWLRMTGWGARAGVSCRVTGLRRRGCRGRSPRG